MREPILKATGVQIELSPVFNKVMKDWGKRHPFPVCTMDDIVVRFYEDDDGKFTVCHLKFKNGTGTASAFGVAKRATHRNSCYDEYDPETGTRIAFRRALLAWLKGQELNDHGSEENGT